MKIITQHEIDFLISSGKIILIRDKYVYNVTNFKLHPGGYKCLENKCGQNVDYDYNFHSSNAKKIWKEYCIGTTKKIYSLCTII